MSTPPKGGSCSEQPAPEETPSTSWGRKPRACSWGDSRTGWGRKLQLRRLPTRLGRKLRSLWLRGTPEPAVAEKKPVDTGRPWWSHGRQWWKCLLLLKSRGVDEFNWILFTPHDLLVFDGEFTTCHGRYRSDTAYAVGDTAEISSAWKNLLTPPTEKQMAFVKEQDLVYAPLESD